MRRNRLPVSSTSVFGISPRRSRRCVSGDCRLTRSTTGESGCARRWKCSTAMPSFPVWAGGRASRFRRWSSSSRWNRPISTCWIGRGWMKRRDLAPAWRRRRARGRGRGGRSFHSVPGGNVLLSLLWPVALPPAELMGLSPAVGVAVARVLESEGVEGVGLKWPNDVLVRGRKVSGILLELGQDRRGCGVLVVGVGINVRLDQATARAIDQPWTDLHRSLGRTPSRSRVAGRIIDQVVHAIRLYMERGFDPFRSPYRERDWLRGKALRVEGTPRELLGIGRGVDERGALLIEEEGRVTALLSGDVSVRAAS